MIRRSCLYVHVVHGNKGSQARKQRRETDQSEQQRDEVREKQGGWNADLHDRGATDTTPT